jgi:hypothetical protein
VPETTGHPVRVREEQGKPMADDLNGEAAAAKDRPAGSNGRKLVAGVALMALLVGGAALGLAVSGAGGHVPTTVTCGPTTPRLTVLGTGQASATPDVLIAVMAVNATAGSAKAALNQDNVEVAAAVTALTQGGVARKDIQTTGLNLQAQYAYPKGVPTVTGYQVSNTVTATLHQIATAGTAIDAVVGSAGNAVQINSLTFSFNHPAAVEDMARVIAVHQAVSHAHSMAVAAGRRLGPVCSLTDKTQTPIQPQTFAGSDLAQAASPSAAVPLEPGTQSESDQVTLVYALN